MNGKNIGIIAAVSAAVIIGVIASVLAYYSSTPDLANSDEEDSIQVVDSATVEELGQDFFIDEEGKKVYIIEAGDSPSIGDGG